MAKRQNISSGNKISAVELECFFYINKKNKPSGVNDLTGKKANPKLTREYKSDYTGDEYPPAVATTPKPTTAHHRSKPYNYRLPLEYVSQISSRLTRYKTSSAKTVLMFEKDEHFASILMEEGFSLENSFKVRVATDSSRPLEKIQLLKPELLVIEPDMSPVNGWDIIRMLKSHKHLSRIPIILMSARYNTPSDIIAGLEEFGADDYLVKPFPTRILVARAKAVLRRAGDAQMSEQENKTASSGAALFEDDPEAIKSNGIAISPLYRKVVANGADIQLTPAEFSILYFIMKHRNRAVSRDEIIYAVYDSADDIFSRAVDRHISEIRRKLNDDGTLIKTVFGSGYMFSSQNKIFNQKYKK